MKKPTVKRRNKKELNLKTISGVACYILIVIYETQLNNIELVEELKIGFEMSPFAGKCKSKDYYNEFELAKKLLSITNNVSILIGAFRYLKDKDFLVFDESRITNDGYSFHSFHLTANGIDVIENSKINPLKSKEFARTFNLGLSFNVDSIIKANSIVGVGGAASVELGLGN